MKQLLCVIAGILILGSCTGLKNENLSVKNSVYVLESVKDGPSGKTFSFRDYCAFNAARGASDSDLDKTLAETDARLELHFHGDTAELKLKSGNRHIDESFLEYQKYYAARFSFSENKDAVTLMLNLDNVDETMRASIEAMSKAERDAVLKSAFEKSKDTLIEIDVEDDVVNYWRRAE